jgi:phosphonate transport system substrate-binding protein
MCKILIIILTALVSLSCQKKEVTYQPTYGENSNNSPKKRMVTISIHPLHNAVRIQEMYGPIIKILEKNIPEAEFQIESSKSYDEFNRKIQSKRIDIILPNPYQTLEAIKYGYQVFAKMGDDVKFRGIVLIRKDSTIDSIKKLKGKTISFPAPSALAAAMMPQYYIESRGASFKKDNIKTKYVGSQESSILAVYYKEVDAGSTWVMAWESFKAENKEIAKELKPLFITEQLLNNSLMAKSDFPPDLLIKVKDTFLNLHKTNEGNVVLNRIKLSKFEDASNQNYEIVKQFLTQYLEKFGELPF